MRMARRTSSTSTFCISSRRASLALRIGRCSSSFVLVVSTIVLSSVLDREQVVGDAIFWDFMSQEGKKKNKKKKRGSVKERQVGEKVKGTLLLLYEPEIVSLNEGCCIRKAEGGKRKKNQQETVCESVRERGTLLLPPIHPAKRIVRYFPKLSD